MGNKACVAGGGTPNRIDVTVINQTDINFHLGESLCQRTCNHKGWAMSDGKIVAGCEPPVNLLANESAKFSVSGRQASLIKPHGMVTYTSENCEFSVKWIKPIFTSNMMADEEQNKKKKLAIEVVKGNISGTVEDKKITIQAI